MAPALSSNYSATFELRAELRGEPVVVVSKPGLPGGHEVGAVVELAAEQVALEPGERVLLLGCSHGALGVVLARQLTTGRLTLHDTSLVALRMSARTLAANNIAGVDVSAKISRLPDEAGRYDRIVLLAPQSRALARRWLVEAHALLRVGGVLDVAGANGGGIQALVADTKALFGTAHVLGYGGGCRVAEALRSATPPALPAWASEPGIAPGTWTRVRAELPGGPAELMSLPGVFSYDRLDAGTALLLQHLPMCKGMRVLDIGCGYGVLGLAAAQQGATQVELGDVNLLAIAAAGANIERLGLAATVRAVPGDALDAATGRYDLVVSNPPFHAGKAVDTTMAHAFITQARAHLAPGGRLVLVANRFLPYERELKPHFARVASFAESGSYKLLAGEAS